MNNPPPNVFHLNQQQAQNVVDGMFEDSDDDNSLNSENYEEKYIKDFPPDKIPHVIGVAQLEPNVVYYKVMDNNTKFDRTQLKFTKNEGNATYWFSDNFGHNMIPLTNQSRFIPAYLMLDSESYPNPLQYKSRFFSIYGIDNDETSNDEDSSDSDMSVGGKKRTPSKKQKKFHFTSTQKHQHGGKKTVRHVSIKNGKGHKKVSHYRGNKLIRTIKKSLKKPEMEMIRHGKFIPGLFRDCQVSRKKGTTRYRCKK